MKSLKELTRFQKTNKKIIQGQFQMRMIKKYLKRDAYLQKKNKKLQHNIKNRTSKNNEFVTQYTKSIN